MTRVIRITTEVLIVGADDKLEVDRDFEGMVTTVSYSEEDGGNSVYTEAEEIADCINRIAASG